MSKKQNKSDRDYLLSRLKWILETDNLEERLDYIDKIYNEGFEDGYNTGYEDGEYSH